MIEILMSNIPAAVATIGLILYFFGMAIVFIVSPLKNAESFSIKPVDNAGKTEIRVYYGGISGALGGFLLFLMLALKTPYYSMIGGLFFATTVFVTRTIFLCVDKGWKCPYTKLAIPRVGGTYYFFVNDQLFAVETSLRGLTGENVVGGCLVFNMGIRVQNYNVISGEAEVQNKLQSLGVN